MKRTIIYIFLICGLCLTAGCNDFLDTVPDSRTEINTSAKFISLVASAYPQGNYGAVLSAREDNVSDIGQGSTTPTNSASFFWRDVDDTASDSPNWLWVSYYKSVADVNYALRAAEEEKFRDVEPYIAEAKIIRAFSHFNLVNLFSRFYDYGGANDSPGIPYVTEPETTVIKQYDRGTVASTYAAIEKDLTEGLKDVGTESAYSVPAYHFTRKAANAFAVRFYLYQGKWAKVVEHANLVFPSPVAEDFVNETFRDATDEEGNVLTDGDGNPVQELVSRNVGENAPVTLYAKANFQDWYKFRSMGSGAWYSKIDIWSTSSNKSNLLVCTTRSRWHYGYWHYRYGTSVANYESTVTGPNPTTGKWIYYDNVYVSDLLKFYSKFDGDYIEEYERTFFTYLRQEEVLLSRAEAYAMLDEYDKAIDDMNIFCRQRTANAASVVYSETAHIVTKQRLLDFYGAEFAEEKDPQHYMNRYDAYNLKNAPLLKKCLLQFILDCRRNEYMWEGLRYWDIVRYRVPVTHRTYDGDSHTIYPGDDRWVLQIPETVTMSGLALNPRNNPKW